MSCISLKMLQNLSTHFTWSNTSRGKAQLFQKFSLWLKKTLYDAHGEPANLRWGVQEVVSEPNSSAHHVMLPHQNKKCTLPQHAVRTQLHNKLRYQAETAKAPNMKQSTPQGRFTSGLLPFVYS